MNKLIYALTLPGLLLPSLSHGQTLRERLKSAPVSGYEMAPINLSEYTRQKDRSFSLELPANPTVSSLHASTRNTIAEVTIGRSTYDLQSNASMYRRIINNNGEISAIWTFSREEESGFLKRGIAYNHFDGNTWINNYQALSNNLKIEPENDRTGFGDLILLEGSELIFSHHTGNSGLYRSHCTEQGSQNWVNTALTDIPVMWPRAAAGGSDRKTVHVIGICDTSEFNGVPLLNGMDAALLYSRSIDGGIQFDKKNVLLPGIDSTRYRRMGADNYAIDARGNTVAFVYGALSSSIVLYKSDDNGETWTNRTIRKIMFEPWDNQLTDFNRDGDASDSVRIISSLYIETNSTSGRSYLVVSEGDTAFVVRQGQSSYVIVNGDTSYIVPGIDSSYFHTRVFEMLSTSDGTFEIYIDDEGTVHVWFGDMLIINDNATDDLLYYLPGMSGIMYWNEHFGTNEPRLIADLVDDDGNGVEYLIRFNERDPQNRPTGSPGPFPYDGIGSTTRPSLGVDDNGTFYLIYEAVKEGRDYFNINSLNGSLGPSFRHIYMVTSDDNGQTWSQETDLTVSEEAGFDPYGEYAYPSVARKVDDHLHIVYQLDETPGSFIEVENPLYHAINNNRIIYLKVPPSGDVGIDSPGKNGNTTLLYPNPVSGGIPVTVNISLREPETVTVSLLNSTGQLVLSREEWYAGAGTQQLRFPTGELQAGLYLVSVSTSRGTTTGKLIVGK